MAAANQANNLPQAVVVVQAPAAHQQPARQVYSREYLVSQGAFHISLTVLLLISFLFMVREIFSDGLFPGRERIPLSNIQISVLGGVQSVIGIFACVASSLAKVWMVIVYTLFAILVSLYYFTFIIGPIAGTLCVINIIASVAYACQIRQHQLRQQQ